jgi:diguanylate cyclase (GGDEF)-like protein
VGGASIAFAELLGYMFPAQMWLRLGGMAMSLDGSVATLACAISLALSDLPRLPAARIVTRLFALVAALASTASLTEAANVKFWMAHAQLAAHPPAMDMAPAVAVSFLLLTVLILGMQTALAPASYVVDAALLGLGWVVLALISASIFAMFRVFSASVPVNIPPMTILVLTLLLIVVFLRRANCGAFDVFLGHGIGGRVARGLLPVLIVLPFFREVTRARMIRLHRLPEHYAAAILTSFGTVISMVLLIWISRQFRKLEGEVQNLSLRDELTGLYNLRGFQLLAKQALRLSQRSHVPFSVLFVDVDNLKQINDRFGHGEGSRLLVETAEFLQTHFRESDVVARIGGDEFAVAGHFSRTAIEMAEKRLEASSLAEDGFDLRLPRLSLSMGHVTADPGRHESLQHLLDRADAAMYEQKRLKKLQLI